MLTASIVIYNTERRLIENLLRCTIDSGCTEKIYVIDNSPTAFNEGEGNPYAFIKNMDSGTTAIEYIPHENTGYGSSHNIAIKKAFEAGSTYHVVLNPDIRFEKNVLPALVSYMDENQDTVYMLPKTTYPDGRLQYLCKLLPTPFNLIFRRFLPKNPLTRKLDDQYTLKNFGYDRILNAPCLSGCFMFMRTSALKDNGILFDEKYFMYCEDFDLIRRLHRIGKTIFYPDVTIIHDHAKESYKNRKMLKIHIQSALRYFNKFGWFIDRERHQWNKEVLKEVESCNNDSGR